MGHKWLYKDPCTRSRETLVFENGLAFCSSEESRQGLACELNFLHLYLGLYKRPTKACSQAGLHVPRLGSSTLSSPERIPHPPAHSLWISVIKKIQNRTDRVGRQQQEEQQQQDF